jgi:hypothetical protein
MADFVEPGKLSPSKTNIYLRKVIETKIGIAAFQRQF